MQRIRFSPRAGWAQKCEAIGFAFHTLDGETYWDESVAYAFTAEQIDTLEAAMNTLHALCLEAVDFIIRHRRYAQLRLSPRAIALIEHAWNAREPSLYGRFDFSWNGEGPPKLLEYNADTPTALYEAAVVQWQWLQDVAPDKDQFNAIHERLIERWSELRVQGRVPEHFIMTSVPSAEDRGTALYLREVAEQAGLRTEYLAIDDIGFNGKHFVDRHNRRIEGLFKLYPWEWMSEEPFAAHLLSAAPCLVEPAWKMLLSNKGVLAILWELFPDHPNLLPAFFDNRFGNAPHAVKPLLSREGANVRLVDGPRSEAAPGPYDGPVVYQALARLPCFDGAYPVLGGWMVGDTAAGLGIREDATAITRDTSRFVPHFFHPEPRACSTP
ncbi:MAG: glutathionylspermidine synthase family protein [Halothiobacillaceae bacterium]|nr:glutathionylspermidine synthase family protein [Halothiobacillaceae bacterium]